ncbi:MAG: hypothetical protein SPL05_04275 [Eubacteriales bacterium]|nr:hypothetical protein [Eubacteriales bacterium]
MLALKTDTPLEKIKSIFL